jgi:predicted PurR-regulated permease PerM
MTESSRSQRWVQWAGHALILSIALLVLRPFLIALGWAAILAFATWPVFGRVQRRLGGRIRLAALAMILLVVLVILIPATLLSLALATEIGRTFAEMKVSAPALPSGIVAALREVPWVGPPLANRVAGTLANPAAIERWVLDNAGGWPSAIASAAGNVGRNALEGLLALVTLFFLYLHGDALARQVLRALSRAGGERMVATFRPLAETVRAVMYGTLLTALAQGVLAMTGYWVAGLRAPVLLGALSALLALTPVGTAFVYVPASVWLLLEGRMAAGLLLLGWGMFVVSLADNLIRSCFLTGALQLPFLLGFFGVLGGVLAFGPIGLFVGPIVVAMLLALWREWTAEP